MYPLWDQIKAYMQSISGIVHKQADTLDRTTATLDETTVTANEAHEAASYSRQRIDGKMDSVNPTGKGAFIMNPRNLYEYGEDSSSLGWGAATGDCAHAEGYGTLAKGDESHAEGNTTKANGSYSHAEGMRTEANGNAGHAEGWYTVAGGRSLDSGTGGFYAHAEGTWTDASGTASHAEGAHTTASMEAAHAEGKGTKARSDYSHAEGYCTEVASKTAIAQHVQGKANIVDAEGKYAHIVGNGEATYNVDGTFTIDKASNAHTLDWNGNAWFQGEVYVGGEDQDNGATKLAKQNELALKLDKTGWAPNKVLTTDANGNVVAAEIEIQSPDSPDSPVEEQPLYSGSFTDLVASAHNHVTLNFNLTAGTKYDVYVNGEKHTVTCENLLVNAMLVIGNKHIIQDSQTDTGEPFFIYEKTGSTDAGKQYILVGTSGDYEISIYKAKAGGGSASNSGGASLAGKKILILGDSVNAGNGWAGGFVNLINEDFEGVTVNNAAVAGAQFAGGDIYGELTLAFQSGFSPDYILFDGGGNDILLGAVEGTIDIETYSAGGYGNEFDKNTIAGAFEHLVTNMQKFFPASKIIFFNLYKMHPEATEVTYTKQKQVWDLLRECCEKYSIKHVDLWREGNFTPNSKEQWNMFMFDWVHINEAGYRRFWPLIKKALMEV